MLRHFRTVPYSRTDGTNSHVSHPQTVIAFILDLVEPGVRADERNVRAVAAILGNAVVIQRSATMRRWKQPPTATRNDAVYSSSNDDALYTKVSAARPQPAIKDPMASSIQTQMSHHAGRAIIHPGQMRRMSSLALLCWQRLYQHVMQCRHDLRRHYLAAAITAAITTVSVPGCRKMRRVWSALTNGALSAVALYASSPPTSDECCDCRATEPTTTMSATIAIFPETNECG
jgi:hypothetical protein